MQNRCLALIVNISSRVPSAPFPASPCVCGKHHSRINPTCSCLHLSHYWRKLQLSWQAPPKSLPLLSEMSISFLASSPRASTISSPPSVCWWPSLNFIGRRKALKMFKKGFHGKAFEVWSRSLFTHPPCQISLKQFGRCSLPGGGLLKTEKSILCFWNLFHKQESGEKIIWVCKFTNFFCCIDLSQKTYGNVSVYPGFHEDGPCEEGGDW